MSPDLTLSVGDIVEPTPVHPKNWLTVFPVYEILLVPDIIVPEFANPIVESTLRIEEPTETVSKALVFGVIMKVPWTADWSSYPTNNSSW